MKIRGRDIGICSWSFRTDDVEALIAALSSVGLQHMQLSVGPYLDQPIENAVAARQRFADAGVTLTAGMVGFAGESYGTIAQIRQTGGFLPDDLAAHRVERAIAASRVAKEGFGLSRISTHAGFLPPTDSDIYPAVRQRIVTVVDALAEIGVDLLFETGQETAPHLRDVLNDIDRPNVYANFDPGNMILYGAGDPVAAVHTLGSRIGHIHVKDAIASDKPGIDWGKEVAPGDGQVNWRAFLDALDEIGYRGPLVIEREAGPDRIGDVARAIETLRKAE